MFVSALQSYEHTQEWQYYFYAPLFFMAQRTSVVYNQFLIIAISFHMGNAN